MNTNIKKLYQQKLMMYEDYPYQFGGWTRDIQEIQLAFRLKMFLSLEDISSVMQLVKAAAALATDAENQKKLQKLAETNTTGIESVDPSIRGKFLSYQDPEYRFNKGVLTDEDKLVNTSFGIRRHAELLIVEEVWTEKNENIRALVQVMTKKYCPPERDEAW